MAGSKGQSLELFFIDGKPDGMLTAEIFNWTGHVLMTPRTQLAEALKRREARYTGVYILLGENDEGKPRAYIGESEDIGDRIRSHDTKLDWWTNAVLITSMGNNLHKAHVKYIEARLVEEAHRTGRFILANGNTPPRSSLSEAATANMEKFVEQIFVVLPAIRIDGFIQNIRPPSANIVTMDVSGATSITVFELKTPKHGVVATAHLQGGEFIVQAGSLGRLSWEGSSNHAYKKLFDELAQTSVFVPQGTHRIFAQAYAFKSPSAAAAVLNGRATNGPESWRLASDISKTYRQWETEQLNTSGP